MCFTPAISLATAIFEWIVVVLLLTKYSRSHVAKFFAFFIFLLGFYQFSEFMLCQTASPKLWAQIGFITFSFLPAIAFHFCWLWTHQYRYARYAVYIYLLPIAFVTWAVVQSEFIISASCSQFFVTFDSTLYVNKLMYKLYMLYYGGTVLALTTLLVSVLFRKKEDSLHIGYLVMLLITIISLALPLLTVVVFPQWDLYFPSIYCQFAVLFTIAALVSAHVDQKSVLAKRK